MQEIQGITQQENTQGQGKAGINLQVGMVLTHDPPMADPVFDRFSLQPCPNAEFFRMWGRFFSPLGDPQSQIPIVLNWAP
jgi:hypothetical protein